MVCQHYGRRLRMILAGVLGAIILSGTVYSDDKLAPYRIMNAAIPEPLTAQRGAADGGPRTVQARGGRDCPSCPAMPLPQRDFQAPIAPPLDGMVRRATAGFSRLRLFNQKALTPATIMPAYYKIEGLHRV